MVGTGGCGSHLGLPGKVCSWKSSTGDGQRQAALCPRSAGPPAWTRLQPCVYLLAVIPVLGAPELGELLGGGHLERLGASGETVQDLGSCRSVGEQHGLPGALPGLGWGGGECRKDGLRGLRCRLPLCWCKSGLSPLTGAMPGCV